MKKIITCKRKGKLFITYFNLPNIEFSLFVMGINNFETRIIIKWGWK